MHEYSKLVVLGIVRKSFEKRKEVENNNQLKDDRKDSKLIAYLVKDDNFGMPYLPEKLYAELRRLSMPGAAE